MKRRPFLASIAGLFAAPFVVKKASVVTEEILDDRYGWQIIARRTNGKLETFSRPKPVERIRRTVWQEWKNSGGMIEHATDPGKIHDSFVVKVDWV
jgi:hypothetical protein